MYNNRLFQSNKEIVLRMFQIVNLRALQPLGPEDDCIFNWVNFGASPALWIHLLSPVKSITRWNT